MTVPMIVRYVHVSKEKRNRAIVVGSMYSHSRPFRTDKPLWLDEHLLLVDNGLRFTFRLPFNVGVH
jgi:hypothetical protein